MKEKVQLTILLLACLFSQSMAQLPANFAPVGARWEYNYYNYALEEGRYIHESVGDTTINGLPHRIIKSENGTPNEEWEISKYKANNTKITADKFVKKDKPAPAAQP